MENNRWWEDCVFYQIYPRSFMDSNNDGIGDIRGIISKLDYLKWLGIGAVWLCPVYASPNADMGYDISNYEAIMDEFGSMEDFEELIQEMHKRDIKLIMDLVVNHSSDEHKWFIESRKSKNNPYRDYYIWRDGKKDKEPNNWGSFFAPSAWTYDEETKQWYLHLFSEKQPDLNWDNPLLRSEVYGMINRWFDKGVDGFRMDVISLIAKNPLLPDGIRDNKDQYVLAFEHFAFQPKLHEYLKEMREKCFDGRNCMCVGETTFVNTENANSVVGDGRELDLLFQFDLMDIDADGPKWNIKPFSLIAFKEIINKWQEAIRWNTLFWSNHDQPRTVSRFGDTSSEELWKKSAKMLAVAMYLLRGTPFIYQGEEIGMTNMPFKDKSELRDIESLNMLLEANYSETAWKGVLAKGRDNARTPMQWDDSMNGGFTKGNPWIKSNQNYKYINVANEMKDEDSILKFYKKLISYRNNKEIIKKGSFEILMKESEEVFAYTRKLTIEGQEKEVQVYCNFTEKPVKICVPEKGNIVINLDWKGEILGKYGALVIEI